MVDNLQADAMVKAREANTFWYKNIFGGEEALLPLLDEKVKAFCADLASAGYRDASSTVVSINLACANG